MKRSMDLTKSGCDRYKYNVTPAPKEVCWEIMSPRNDRKASPIIPQNYT